MRFNVCHISKEITLVVIYCGVTFTNNFGTEQWTVDSRVGDVNGDEFTPCSDSDGVYDEG